MPEEIEMTRQEFCTRFGFWPSPQVDAYNFYTPDGILTSSILLIPDSETIKAEVDWLEKLYAL